jgi:hypothetical protein
MYNIYTQIFKLNVMARFYFLFIRRAFPDFCDLFKKKLKHLNTN